METSSNTTSESSLSKGDAQCSLPVNLLGLPVFAPTQEQIQSVLESPKSGTNVRARYIANVSFRTLLNAQDNKSLLRVLNLADYLYPTGVPARLASRLFGLSYRKSESLWSIANQVLQLAEANQLTCYVLGQRPTATSQPSSRISRRYPELQLIGQRWVWPEDWSAKEAFELNKELRDLRPDVILSSLTHIPAKIWMAENGRSLAKRLVVDLGASDHLFARVVAAKSSRLRYSRASRRLASAASADRKRASYLSQLGDYLFKVFGQRQVLRTCQQKAPAFPKSEPFPKTQRPDITVVTLPARFDRSFLLRFYPEAKALERSNQGVVLDASAILSFDMSALGWMLHLTKNLQLRGYHAVIQDPSLSLVRFLQYAEIPESLHTRYNQSAAEDLARESAWLRAETDDPTSEAIVWKGNVTAQTADTIWQDALALIKRNEQRTQSFQVDLSRVTLLDSTGIGIMIKLKKRLLKQGYRLAYVNPKQNVRKTLEMTQLAKYLLED